MFEFKYFVNFILLCHFDIIESNVQSISHNNCFCSFIIIDVVHQLFLKNCSCSNSSQWTSGAIFPNFHFFSIITYVLLRFFLMQMIIYFQIYVCVSDSIKSHKNAVSVICIQQDSSVEEQLFSVEYAHRYYFRIPSQCSVVSFFYS